MRVRSSTVNAKHSHEYAAALASTHWKELIKIALARSNATCESCRRSPFDSMKPIHLSLHHLTYERLEKELETDVILLCEDCHKAADARRAQETAMQRSARLYHARVNGWATKVYGEDWHEHQDENSVYERFDRWAEHQEE